MIPEPLARRYEAEGLWGPETLMDRFSAVVGRFGAGTAVLDDEATLTFRQAHDLSGRLAGHLSAMGVEPGDVVSWLLPNWWESVVVHHAALRAGAIANPLNAIFRERELAFVLAEAAPRVVIVPPDVRGFDAASAALTLQTRIPSLEHVIVARGFRPGAIELSALLDEPAEPPRVAVSPAAPALLLYTSGTTADPKGVVHSHRTLLYEIDSLRHAHGLGPQDRYLGGSPVTHIAGLVYGVLMPFALGTSVTFLARWDPQAAAALVERDRATFQTGTPTFLATLAENAGGADVSSFRLFSTGGASIDSAMVRDAGRRLGCVVKRAYGSTEAPTLTATLATDPDDVRLEWDGRAIGAAELRIVRDGVAVPAGREGEIHARSPELFLGYRNPALEAFDAGGWYATGDLGIIDERGLLRVTGRIKDIIIRGGENISAAEVESLLSSHPSIADVAVVGLPDSRLGEIACAVVVPRDGATITLEQLRSFLGSMGVARQKIPERIEIRAALPRTASGKVAKPALRAEIG